jgi:transcription antitermination factor NusG
MIHWYILQTKPNKEEFVLHQLNFRNISGYYPNIKAQPVNPRSRKIKPYFPGYLFINANLDLIGTSMLRWIPGTVGLVTFGNEFASVPDDLLETIRQHVDRLNLEHSKSFERFTAGDKVLIQSGPFSGYQAIFDSYAPGYKRVQVLLQMLQDRQIKVDLAAVAVTFLNMYQSISN